jgi:carboxyl-terminal processing protease
VIGQRTWGKGSVQNIIELEDGKSAIKLTTAGYRRPNGKNIHRRQGASDDDVWGVFPNEGFELKLSVSQTRKLDENRQERDILKKRDPAEQVPAAEDLQLAKALDYLRQTLDKSDNEPGDKDKSEEKTEDKAAGKNEDKDNEPDPEKAAKENTNTPADAATVPK